jgi:hypothetical protein
MFPHQTFVCYIAGLATRSLVSIESLRYDDGRKYFGSLVSSPPGTGHVHSNSFVSKLVCVPKHSATPITHHTHTPSSPYIAPSLRFSLRAPSPSHLSAQTPALPHPLRHPWPRSLLSTHPSTHLPTRPSTHLTPPHPYKNPLQLLESRSRHSDPFYRVLVVVW